MGYNDDSDIGHWPCFDLKNFDYHVFPYKRKYCNCGKYYRDENDNRVLNPDYKKEDKIKSKE